MTAPLHVSLPLSEATAERFAFNAKINSSLLQDRDAFAATEYALLSSVPLRPVWPQDPFGGADRRNTGQQARRKTYLFLQFLDMCWLC